MKETFQYANQRRSQRKLRWISRGLFIAGGLTLGFYAVIMLYTYLHQFYLSRSFEHSLTHKPVITAPMPAVPTPRVAPDGSLLGRLEVPRLDLSVVILEGTDLRTLQSGAGHIPGTAFPGEPGNVGIAAHRDTFFRALQKIRKDDRIQLTTLDGSYQYVVESMKVVDPDDAEVLAASNDPMLTLVTCYPFYFIGSAPKRFIVCARRVSG
jgi:sortase A